MASYDKGEHEELEKVEEQDDEFAEDDVVVFIIAIIIIIIIITTKINPNFLHIYLPIHHHQYHLSFSSSSPS